MTQTAFLPKSLSYYYRARYYSPAVGRFISEDPEHYSDSPNLYQAFLNNPISNTDPTGRANITSGVRINENTIPDVITPINNAVTLSQGTAEDYKIGLTNTADQIAFDIAKPYLCFEAAILSNDMSYMGCWAWETAKQVAFMKGTGKLLELGNASPFWGRRVWGGSPEVPIIEYPPIVRGGPEPVYNTGYTSEIEVAAPKPETLPVLHTDSIIARQYQQYYNEAWLGVVDDFNAGNITLNSAKNWQVQLGQRVDSIARFHLKEFLRAQGIPEGPTTDVLVNRWLRNPNGPGYRIPDLKLIQTRRIFDGTIGNKLLTDPQAQDFINFSNGYRLQFVKPTVGPRPH